MKIVLMLGSIAILGAGVLCAEAQFPFKLPKIKAEKPKTEQPSRPESSGSIATSPSPRGSAAGRSPYGFIRTDARPILVKDSVYIQASTAREYWKMPGKPQNSWIPTVRFNLYYNWVNQEPHLVEYFHPDGTLWFSETLEGESKSASGEVPFKSGGVFQTLKTKAIIDTGVYGIKITTVKSGEVAFQGKFKVGKFPIVSQRATTYDYYVDHDWLLPIGNISFHFSNFQGEDLGFNFPVEVAMWFKNNPPGSDHGLEARLFYKGQQIATTTTLVGREDRATDMAALSAEEHHWKLVQFQWSDAKINVDNGGEYHPDNMPKSFFIDRNPGEYTIKVLKNGTQVREAKFTVGTDGRIADGGYHKPGYLNSHKVLIPVTVTPGSEKWNANAWKTEAFYGNPMTGFEIK